jgi:cytochrome b561
MSTSQVLSAHDNALDRYPLVMRLLHWLTALLIAGMFFLGGWIVYFDPGNGPFKHRLFNLHESTGALLWVLVLIRIVVRLATGAPRLPAETPASVRLLASLNQLGLYLMLLVQPIIGLMNANAHGVPLRWFELFVVPSTMDKQPEAVAHSLSAAHWVGAAVLLALLVLHIAGAAYHGLIRRDGVMRHMV